MPKLKLSSVETLAARLFLPPLQSRSAGWLIRAGDDFPISVEQCLRSWQVALHVEKVTGQWSTRGLLKYLDESFGRQYLLSGVHSCCC
jgi:hypothetical protein